MTDLQAQKLILRNSQHASHLGLERMKSLNKLVGQPDRKLKFVHVAGTNGKGSISTMIANALICSGYRVGLFISPSVLEFNERFQIDGMPISDEELTKTSERLQSLFELMPEPPTEFELITEIAFEYFAKKQCDIVVLETGLGGRLDATNIIKMPEVSVITSISFDHTEQLGSSLGSIAKEKAGIIKQNSDVVLFEQSQEVTEIVKDACIQNNAKLWISSFNGIKQKSSKFAGQEVDLPGISNVFLTLLGEHQAQNACVAFKALEVLRSKGWQISDECIRDSFAKTKLPARFEILQKDRIIVLDGAHNPSGAEVLVTNLKNNFKNRIVFVFGVLADKDYKLMGSYLSSIAKKFYVFTPSSPRALSSIELADNLRKWDVPIVLCGSAADAAKRAIFESDPNDVVCVAGTLSCIYEIQQKGILL